MSHDLDDALRSAMRRHAEDAPSRVDADGIRLRAQRIQRRHVAGSVAAAFAALVLVGGVALAVGSLRTDATPPPVTTGTPTPSVTRPTTYADLPWVASVIPYLTPGGATADKPYGGNKLVVTVDGRQTEVYDAGNAAITLVGWYGPDHRTLVYSTGQDVVGELREATFSAGGTPERTSEPLSIDGSTMGVATPLPTGGFAWVPLRTATLPGTDETVDYVDDSLQVAAQRPAPHGVALVTRDVVVSGSGLTLTVTGDDGSQVRALPAACAARSTNGPDDHGTDAVTADGGFAALACGTHVVLVSLDPAVAGGVDELPAVPGGGSVIAAWFDPQGRTLASSADRPRATTSTSVRTSVWSSATQAWAAAPQQNVESQMWSGEIAFSLYADKPGEDQQATPPAWFSETTPRLQVSPTNATLESYGATFATRTPATPASPTPTTIPSTSPPVAVLPWIATSPTYEKPGHAGLTDIRVLIDGRTTVVTTAENAIARTIGWYGPDHLTLVWEEGNGDPGLEAETFRADGTLADKPHPLALPGVTPSTRGGGMLFGATVAVPGDGFVTWSEGTGANGSSEYIRVDDALSVVSRTPAGDEAGVYGASRDAFVTLAGNAVKANRIVVHTSTGATTLDLPTPCGDASEGLFGGPMSSDGALLPLWCQPVHGVSWTVDLLDVAGLRFTTSVLQGSNIPTFWWDGTTLHASTTDGLYPPVAWGLWQLAGEQWSAAPDGTPVQQVRSGGAVLVERSDSTWYAETDPEVTLDSADPPAARPSS